MVKMTLQQVVEYFHLTFLLFIVRKIERRHYILKGGCNMRFFFGSPRYSEDIDFDLLDIPVDVFRESVNTVLKIKSFRDVLSASKISVEHITEHKQTETTQRWKIGLFYDGRTMPIPTKVEFSRRGEAGNVRFEAVDSRIIDRYGLTPVLINHYGADAAFSQKLKAIFSRRVPQARDIFDAYLLISSKVLEKGSLKSINKAKVLQIKENILSIDYSVFKSQVLSYLAPGERGVYDSEDVWDTMRLKVIEELEKI